MMRQFFRNFGQIRRMMRRGNDSQEVIRVCPICLRNTLSIQPTFLTFIAPSIYSCSSCEYKGPIYAEVPVEDYVNLVNEKGEPVGQEFANVDNF
ncbi:MAG: hypothetical protein ACXABG_14835 [Promethearchaeota archaeon]